MITLEHHKLYTSIMLIETTYISLFRKTYIIKYKPLISIYDIGTIFGITCYFEPLPESKQQ